MGLVDYGSDSDDDQQPSVPAAPAASSSAPPRPPPSRGLQLPAPKGSASALALPPPKNTAAPPSAPAKKGKGPVRILLDLPPPANTGAASSTDAADDGSARKRPKLALGSGGDSASAPLTGLAAMLPKPKNEPKPQPARPSVSAPAPAAGHAGLDGQFDDGDGAVPGKKPSGGPMFLPPSVAAKAKGKAPAAPPPRPAEPALDFFGIGSVTSTSTSGTSASKPYLSISSAPSISAAPSVSSAPPASSSSAAQPAFGKPTAADPYPGFAQLPSGEWVAKDQHTYDAWMAWSAAQAAGAGATEDKPREFDAAEIEKQGGMVEFDEAQRAREAWANRPSQVPGKEGEEKYKTSAELKGIPSQIGGMARRKHQLSSLLAAAHDNRAELEERIAQARANRKGASSKYGF